MEGQGMDRESFLESVTLLYEETKRKLDELTILYEMTRISQRAHQFDQMLEEMVQALRDFFNFETLSILLMDETTGRFTLHPSSIGWSQDEFERHHLKVGKGITEWVMEQGSSLRIDDVQNDLRFIGNPGVIHSEMCVPLIVEGRTIGVIDTQSKKKGAFSEENLRLFEMAGHHLAQIIENVRSEERYRTVVESALDGVLVMGEDYRLIYVNERLSTLLGYEREFLIGADFLNFLDGKGQEELKKRSLFHQQGMAVPPHFEVSILRSDGESRIVEISSTLIRDSHGNSNHIAFLKDITEKRKMEEQLLQAEKLRAVGEMASGVAHDFNNALAIILGNTQLLLIGAKDQEQINALKIIEKVTKDSAHTVRRLQEFTRSKVRQDLCKMNVNAIVQDAIEITRPKWKDSAQERGVSIEVVTRFGDIPQAAGNVSELREVIVNMIFNAVEAMPQGGRIEIRTFQDPGHVCIQVSDTGIGMTEEVRKKVFEPFFTTKPFTNTGLGLSMAYGIIRRFGGNMEVESEPGRGTTFTISLHTEAEESSSEEPLLKNPSMQRARVLVIDDEEHVRAVLARGLSTFKHQVIEAPSGEQGLELFQKEKVDLVLTDLGMPHLSGWEVCKAIKKISPKTPVGMITGWEIDLDEAKKRESGVDFIISKPFDFTKILHFITQSMEQ